MTEWIPDADALRAFLDDAPAALAMDTEFIRERTYWPRLALVQIACGERIRLVDPLEPGMCEALAPLLEDPRRLKIMHSPSEDLVAFQHACRRRPTPLFDTQHAAALAGLGVGMSYQRLVEQLTGVVVPKGETRSDWLRRPLSEAQCHYAADDVRHLAQVHAELHARLERLGRLDWMQQDMQRLADTEADDDRWPHLAFRTPQPLDAAAQRRLLRLLRWRDGHARQADLPRGWVLDNAAALVLARTPPSSVEALGTWLGKTPGAPLKLQTAIWEALTTPAADEAGMPLSDSSGADDRNALKRLQGIVAGIAAELGLDPSVLASRKPLQQWLLTGEWPASLQGWRRDLLEPQLRAGA